MVVVADLGHVRQHTCSESLVAVADLGDPVAEAVLGLTEVAIAHVDDVVAADAQAGQILRIHLGDRSAIRDGDVVVTHVDRGVGKTGGDGLVALAHPDGRGEDPSADRRGVVAQCDGGGTKTG